MKEEYTLEVELNVGGKEWYSVFHEKSLTELIAHMNQVTRNPEWIHYDKSLRIVKTTVDVIMNVPNYQRLIVP